MASNKGFQYNYLYNGYYDLLEEEEEEEEEEEPVLQQPEPHVQIAMDGSEFFDSDLIMNPPMPMGFEMPGDPDTMMDQYMLEDCDFSDLLQAENHHSDSSDSGVNFTTAGMQIKQETQSNPSSPSSECGSEGYISGQDAFMQAVVKTEHIPLAGVADSSASVCMADFNFCSQGRHPSPSAASLSSPHSSSSSSLSPTSLYPSSPTADQTLIFIPKEEGHDSAAAQLLLPSDLSQFPGSILSPSSTSSSLLGLSSSSSTMLSSTSSFTTSTTGLPSSPDVVSSSMAFSAMPVPLDSILKQKVQILPKPNQGAALVGAKKVAGGRLPAVSMALSGKATPSAATVTPVVPKVELKPVPVKPAAAKKLVLTPEEFTKLTASGALRFQPPSTDPTPIASATNLGSNLLPTASCGLSTAAVPTFSDMVGADGTCSLEHTKSKRQQRMIKNRESASLSRKRKKEYLTSLEEKVMAFTAENQQLKLENEVLKTKVQQLHDENVQLRQNSSRASQKKTIVLFMALFITFNFSAISSFLWWEPQQVTVAPSPWAERPLEIRGRHLLSLTDDSADAAFQREGRGGNETKYGQDDLLWRSEQSRQMMQFDEDLQHLLTRGSLNESLVAAHFCPIYFNSTESSRLAEQLRGWMIREEEVKQKKQTPTRGPRRKKAYPPVNILRAAMRGHYDRDLREAAYRSRKEKDREEADRGTEKKFQMQVFQHNDPRQRLLNAIPRRNDTFYVLSFNTDYFLVPATAHNKTARPRMSLVMPVVSETLNDTMQPPEGSVGMMQIDCEILNTQLIHVRKSAFPQQQQQQHHHQQQQQRSEQSFSSQYANHTAGSPPPHFHTNQTRSASGRQRKGGGDATAEAPSRGAGSEQT